MHEGQIIRLVLLRDDVNCGICVARAAARHDIAGSPFGANKVRQRKKKTVSGSARRCATNRCG